MKKTFKTAAVAAILAIAGVNVFVANQDAKTLSDVQLSMLESQAYTIGFLEYLPLPGSWRTVKVPCDVKEESASAHVSFSFNIRNILNVEAGFDSSKSSGSYQKKIEVCDSGSGGCVFDDNCL